MSFNTPNSQLTVSVVGKSTEQVEDPTAQCLVEAVVGSTEVDFALDTGLHTGLIYTGLQVGNTGPEWAGTGAGWCTGKTVRKDAHQDLGIGVRNNCLASTLVLSWASDEISCTASDGLNGQGQEE